MYQMVITGPSHGDVCFTISVVIASPADPLSARTAIYHGSAELGVIISCRSSRVQTAVSVLPSPSYLRARPGLDLGEA